jgi:hypothetical protein
LPEDNTFIGERCEWAELNVQELQCVVGQVQVSASITILQLKAPHSKTNPLNQLPHQTAKSDIVSTKFTHRKVINLEYITSNESLFFFYYYYYYYYYFRYRPTACSDSEV